MDLKLKENKWLYLAWSSLTVAGTYILLDLYNKWRLQSKRHIPHHKNEEEEDKSEDSMGFKNWENFVLFLKI